jgi:putative ABC transport system substrate-binding protein
MGWILVRQVDWRGSRRAEDVRATSLFQGHAAGAAKHKLPALYTDLEYVSAGGLMALGPGHYEGYHGAAKYVDKILRGANPAELPVAGATQVTFSASRSALAKLGLSLPPDSNARVNDWLD